MKHFPAPVHMDLQELKNKFRHKTKAEIADIDVALQAVPFLVRKIESLEGELSEYEKRTRHLEQKLKRQRPFSVKGSKNGMNWLTNLDDKKNRLLLVFSGETSHKTAKLASNSIQPVFSNMRKGCNVIIDISGLSGFTSRVMFHFRKILYTLDMMGAEKVIYILPPGENDIANAFRTASESLGYQTFTAASTEEAASILEKSASFLKA